MAWDGFCTQLNSLLNHFIWWVESIHTKWRDYFLCNKRFALLFYNSNLKKLPFHLAIRALGDTGHTAPSLTPLQKKTSLIALAAKFSIHSSAEISPEKSLVPLVLARQRDWVQIWVFKFFLTKNKFKMWHVHFNSWCGIYF